jgi:hypothetical protein
LIVFKNNLFTIIALLPSKQEILQENPAGIEEENVKTQAIQDNTNASNVNSK